MDWVDFLLMHTLVKRKNIILFLWLNNEEKGLRLFKYKLKVCKNAPVSIHDAFGVWLPSVSAKCTYFSLILFGKKTKTKHG